MKIRSAAALPALLLAGAALAAPGARPAPQDELCHGTTPAASAASAPPAPASQAPVRSLQSVTLPAVRLRTQAGGAPVALADSIGEDRPVLLNFVFTSCTTICPPMTQIFAAAQERLGERRAQVRMISISIDPGQDTPARLREYAARFDAGPQWLFHTGSADAIDAVQRAFNVHRPDKMGHTPVTFVRARGSRQWVRLDGFASPEQLVREALAGGTP